MIRACDTGRDPTGSRPAVTPQHTPTIGISAKKLAQHAIKHRFLALWSMLGELFRARAHSWPSRAKKVPYSALRRGTLKPTTPMLAPEPQPLKPTTPLHPETAPKTPISHPQRRRRFQSRLGRHPQRRWRFQLGLSLREQRRRRFHARDFRCPWAAAGPGRATNGRPTLQTSSNQRNSNHLTRTPVTNVVNPSPKTTIFTEKADGLTTFVTTGQKSTRQTPWIDDVCNNTRRATRQHTRSHWCVGRRRDRTAWLRCPWAAAGPGQATHRHPDRLEAAARPAGPGRASSRRAERSSRRVRRAGGQASRRPEICRGNKQHEAARPHRGRAAHASGR